MTRHTTTDPAERFDHPSPADGKSSAMTLDEIAAAMGCTRERVRQIEVKALRKLRYHMLRSNRSPRDYLPD